MTTLSSELDIPVLDIDPYASANLIDPYPMHERLREAGPVVRLAPYPSVVACARHDEVRAVLNDHATFISGAGVGLTNFNKETPFRPRSLILEADPPLHTQTRTVLSRILSPKTVMQIAIASPRRPRPWSSDASPRARSMASTIWRRSIRSRCSPTRWAWRKPGARTSCFMAT